MENGKEERMERFFCGFFLCGISWKLSLCRGRLRVVGRTTRESLGFFGAPFVCGMHGFYKCVGESFGGQ